MLSKYHSIHYLFLLDQAFNFHDAVYVDASSQPQEEHPSSMRQEVSHSEGGDIAGERVFVYFTVLRWWIKNIIDEFYRDPKEFFQSRKSRAEVTQLRHQVKNAIWRGRTADVFSKALQYPTILINVRCKIGEKV